MTADTQYRGRFSPSPTGPLHFGSLIAAVGSYLQARTANGEWIVRIEDLDTPRSVPGAADAILESLERFGMYWDGPVSYQSQRGRLYEAGLQQLMTSGAAFPCACSRREIREIAIAGADAPVYPGTCRQGIAGDREVRSIRVRTDSVPVSFSDRVFGELRQQLEKEVGDFVIRRADGLFAYQLAVVVDDNEQKITEVVRGCDLLDSTPRQIYLYRLLGLRVPDYAHLPLAVDSDGNKLSKRDAADPVNEDDPVTTLWRCLDFLGQQPAEELKHASLEEFWAWACKHWSLDRVPASNRIIA